MQIAVLTSHCFPSSVHTINNFLQGQVQWLVTVDPLPLFKTGSLIVQFGLELFVVVGDLPTPLLTTPSLLGARDRTLDFLHVRLGT